MSRVARKEQSARTKKDWARILEGIRGTISYEASLQSYTSFRIGGPAEVLVEPADVDDLCRVVAQAHAERLPIFVVGGTNLLVRDGGIRGLVLSLRQLKAIRQEPGSVLYAEGGVGMPTLIGYVPTLKSGDLVITLGAGDIWKAGLAILDRLPA